MFIKARVKPFKSKEFSLALEISRVSFTPAEYMDQMLGTKIGAATVFCALLETVDKDQIVFDNDVLEEEWYGCSDETTRGYMKLKTDYFFICSCRILSMSCM